nr:hypothetical protein CFP56_03998 [Quercus suber]
MHSSTSATYINPQRYLAITRFVDERPYPYSIWSRRIPYLTSLWRSPTVSVVATLADQLLSLNSVEQGSLSEMLSVSDTVEPHLHSILDVPCTALEPGFDVHLVDDNSPGSVRLPRYGEKN